MQPRNLFLATLITCTLLIPAKGFTASSNWDGMVWDQDVWFIDSDGDGVDDANDGCPADATKTEPGICGCGVIDIDSDGDGTADCLETITINGSFETGDYTGWTLIDSSAGPDFGIFGVVSGGSIIDSAIPIYDWYDFNSFTSFSAGLPHTFNSTDGTNVGIHLQNGPGYYRLYQDIALPADAQMLRWDMWWNNNDSIHNPTSQFIAVHIRDNISDTILATLFETTDGVDPGTLPEMTTFSRDISTYAGSTVRIDIELGIQNNFFDVAYDNIRIITPSTDYDGDGIPDVSDNCPVDPNGGQSDADGDQTGDACDVCLNDPLKWLSLGVCGCGVAETDSDGDATPDCIDSCPADSNKIDPGICGCGASDTDSDSDGVYDCNDICPGYPDDVDLDADGFPDGCDNCPSLFNPVQEDIDGDLTGDVCDSPIVNGSSLTNDVTPTWSWLSGGGAGTGSFRYQLDGEDGSWTETSAGFFTPPGPLSDGPHILYVQEEGTPGIWSQSGSFFIEIDSVLPETTLLSSCPELVSDKDVTFDFSYTETNFDHFECRFDQDNAGFTTCTSGTSNSSILYGGSHTFEVRAVDIWGVPDPSPARCDWTIKDRLGANAVSWGWNWYAQLGNGEWSYTPEPVIVDVNGPVGFVKVSTSNKHSVALRNDGTVWTWGYHDWGQLGRVPEYSNVSTEPGQVPGLENVIAISAGTEYTLALKNDGTVWMWGREIRTDTAVYSPVQVTGLSNITTVSAGGDHALALDDTGAVWSWGVDQYGELGRGVSPSQDPAKVELSTGGYLSGVTQISAGAAVSLAIDSGNVVSWGHNDLGQLGLGDQSDRDYATTVTNPACASYPLSISADTRHSAAVYEINGACDEALPGRAFTWGFNSLGALGIGVDSGIYTTPQEVTSLYDVKRVETGQSNTAFLMGGGAVYASGSNYRGQLGRGLYDNYAHPTPEKVAYLNGVEDLAFALGGSHAIALRTTWITRTIDNRNWEGPYSSLALGSYNSKETVNISYYRATDSINRLAFTTNKDGDFTYEDVEVGVDVLRTSLAMDGQTPHICYMATDGVNHLVKYATNNGASWDIETITSYDPNHATAGQGGYCDVVTDGSDVYIAYYEEDPTTPCGFLNLAKKNGAGWDTYPVTTCTAGQYNGKYPSLTVDDYDGHVQVVYTRTAYPDGEHAEMTSPGVFTYKNMDINSGSDYLSVVDLPNAGSPGYQNIAYAGYCDSSGDINFTYNNGSSWSMGIYEQIVDDSENNLCSGFYGSQTSMDIYSTSPASQDELYIAYYDSVNQDLRVAYKYGSASGGEWLTTAVDTQDNVGLFPSLAVDSSGVVHISYYSGYSPYMDLKYARNVDYDAPSGGITFDGGGGFTTTPSVTLNLTCDDTGGIGCWQMKFSNDGINWSAPENFSSTKAWDISNPAYGGTPDDGMKTVYVRYKDSANNWSQEYTYTTTLDTVGSTGTIIINDTGPLNGETETRFLNIILSLTCDDSSGSGCTEMQFSENGTVWSNWEQFVSTRAWILSPGDGLRMMYVKFKDAAGVESSTVSDNIFIDTSYPDTTASPAGGSSGTEQSVSLNCTDNGGVGCATIWYCTSPTGGMCAPSTPYLGPITLRDDTDVRFYSVDTLGNTEPLRQEQYTFIQAGTTLTQSLSSSVILQNGQVDVFGKLSRIPTNGTDLSGIEIELKITPPVGSGQPIAYHYIDTSDVDGHYLFDDVVGFHYKGVYAAEVSYAGDGLLAPATSDAKPLLVGSSAGYAIIVEGRVDGEEGLDSHNKTANRIYQTLIDRGFADMNIMYFNYDDIQPGVDAVPSKTSVKDVIENWARDRMDQVPAPLYVIMEDHGSADAFHIYNNSFDAADDVITPTDLNSWITNLESSLSAPALLEKRIVIIGSCYSGSFIDELSQGPSAGDAGRIVITASANDEVSYKGPQEPDGIRSGEFFLEALFKELSKGYSLGEAFRMATELTEIYTSNGNLAAAANNGYGDTAVQHPMLDDDGDGFGTNLLSDGTGDGSESEDLYLGVGVTNDISNPAEFVKVTETLFLSDIDTSVTLYGEVLAGNNGEVDSAWIEIKAPSEDLTGGGGSSFQVDLNIPREAMGSVGGDRWEATIANNLPEDTSFDDIFPESGKYEIYYFTQQTGTMEVSTMKRSVVYKSLDGNQPPEPFNLVSPADGSQPTTTIVFDWENTTDPDGDQLTYNLVIATDIGFEEIVHKQEELRKSLAIVDASAGLEDLTNYFWKIEAVDEFGGVTDSTETWMFFCNNTNSDPPGVLEIMALSSIDWALIEGANITIDASVFPTDYTGSVIVIKNAGTYTVSGDATGYEATTPVDLLVESGKITSVNLALNADSDGDGVPDTGDNCPDDPNPIQTDSDADGTGDGCDICPNDANNDTDDGDTICVGTGFLSPMTGENDNCPSIANANQADANMDGEGDVCDADSDTDGDSIMDNSDASPLVPDDGSPTLTGTYHAGEIVDDFTMPLQSVGDYLTNRLDFTFDGTVYASLDETATSSGVSGDLVNFFYDPEPDYSFSIVGSTTMVGNISNDERIFVIGDVDPADTPSGALALTVGGLQGSGMDDSYLSGNYVATQYRETNEGGNPAIDTNRQQLVFNDVAGTYSSTTLTDSAAGDPEAVVPVTDVSYTVSGTGELTTSDGTGFVTDDGQLMVTTDTDTTGNEISLTVGVKQGSCTDAGDLSGGFALYEIGYETYTWSSRILVTFDGLGAGTFERQLDSDGQTAAPVSITYAVDTDCNVTIDGTLMGVLSENGEYLVLADTDWASGDPGVSINVGVRTFTAIETCDDGILNQDEVEVDCGGVCVACTADAPNWVTVTPNTANGWLRVAWQASTTAGASYRVIESTDPAFGTSTNIYNNTGLEKWIKRSVGTYYYRVIADVAGYSSSGWVDGANPAVSTMPAFADAPNWMTVTPSTSNGWIRLAWQASTTPAATYRVIESTDPAFGTFSNIYNSTGVETWIKRSGGTYYYRVIADAAGYSSSDWIDGANPAVSTLPDFVDAPNWVTVTPTTSTGWVRIAWQPSTTPGASYRVQESSDPGFGTFITVYNNTGLERWVKRSAGTYYYRVISDAAGLTSSDFVDGANEVVSTWVP